MGANTRTLSQCCNSNVMVILILEGCKEPHIMACGNGDVCSEYLSYYSYLHVCRDKIKKMFLES